MKRIDAIYMALDLLKQPAKLKAILKENSPTDVIELIKLAAGDLPSLSRWSGEIDEPAQVLKEAAKFYLRETMGAAGNNDYKLLGLTSTATAQEIQNHKRWMLKWLHPDKNTNKWESEFFYRVCEAAERLSSNQCDSNTGKLDEINLAVKKPIKSPIVISKNRKKRLVRSVNQTGHKAVVIFVVLAILSVISGWTVYWILTKMNF
jgi:hypothetical protein